MKHLAHHEVAGGRQIMETPTLQKHFARKPGESDAELCERVNRYALDHLNTWLLVTVSG